MISLQSPTRRKLLLYVLSPLSSVSIEITMNDLRHKAPFCIPLSRDALNLLGSEPVIIPVMPFTLSHAAAALPFRRTRLVMSALVFGCFAPDFEYFLGHHGAFGHTIEGMFVFDLPLAFVALWLFHHYLKDPLSACLPAGALERFVLGPRSLSINSFSRFAMIVFSILVGIATHLLWDSFTHPRTWIYYHWDFLWETVNVPHFGIRPWFGIFQYLSSVLGLVIVLLCSSTGIASHRRSIPRRIGGHLCATESRSRLLCWSLSSLPSSAQL